MNSLLIRSATPVHGGDRFDLWIDDGLITATSDRVPAGSVVLDARGLLVAPGLVDLQINGGFGKDLVQEPESMWELGRQLPRHGVTAFLPTIITSPKGTIERALAALRRRPVV